MPESLDEDSPEVLERDVINILRRYSEYGAWIPSSIIGLEAGFERHNAGRNVRPVLKELVARGLVEENHELNQPIIYRWKSWETDQSSEGTDNA